MIFAASKQGKPYIMAFCRHLQTVLSVFILLSLLATPGSVAAQDTSYLKSLSVDDLLRVMHKEDWLLIDTRLPDEYNGWRSDQMTRGGHIPIPLTFALPGLIARLRTSPAN